MRHEQVPVFTEKHDMKEFSRAARRSGKTVALVGTMGGIHAGHLALVAKAKQLADVVVVMIYQNPAQFTVNEDYSTYPKNPEQDVLLMQQAGCDAILMPNTLYHRIDQSAGDEVNLVGHQDQVHPDAHETWVEVVRMQQGLCSAARPAYFRGVATICIKMYNTFLPDYFILGQKDYQQNRVVERLTRDLDFDVQVVEHPTVREADGLAMSSRNLHLTPQGRQQAASLYEALRWAEQAVQQQQITDAAVILQEVSLRITAAGGKIDYVEARHAHHLEPVTGDVMAQPTVVLVAAWFEGKGGNTVRLIDNVVLQ